MKDNIPIHPASLRFTARQLETEFLEYHTRRSLKVVRLALILGFSLYALFGLLDRWMAPGVAEEILVIRIGVCAVITAIYGFTLLPSFPMYMQLSMGLLVAITGAGIVGMVWIAEEGTGYYYYAGLLLVFFFAHGLTRLRFIYALLITLGIIIAYEIVAMVVQSTPATILLNNTFFLIGGNLIGMFTSYILEFFQRTVFWQRRILEEKHRELDAEHDRKTRELNAARQLQISILPKSVPDHPLVDMAVFMKTATEVGGDYYDYRMSSDGILTLAIGDAVGHGAQAGAMVAATKALFTTLAGENDLTRILSRATGTLQQIGNSRLFMALALARLKDSTLELAGAGMPPALIYRKRKECLEQIPLKGMPLGSPSQYPYQTTRTNLGPGDTVMFMTDGLAESFNHKGEMMGYERAAQLFGRIAKKTPPEIISHLSEEATRWSNNLMQQDDITLLVMKVKSGNGKRDT